MSKRKFKPGDVVTFKTDKRRQCNFYSRMYKLPVFQIAYFMGSQRYMAVPLGTDLSIRSATYTGGVVASRDLKHADNFVPEELLWE